MAARRELPAALVREIDCAGLAQRMAGLAATWAPWRTHWPPRTGPALSVAAEASMVADAGRESCSGLLECATGADG